MLTSLVMIAPIFFILAVLIPSCRWSAFVMSVSTIINIVMWPLLLVLSEVHSYWAIIALNAITALILLQIKEIQAIIFSLVLMCFIALDTLLIFGFSELAQKYYAPICLILYALMAASLFGSLIHGIRSRMGSKASRSYIVPSDRVPSISIHNNTPEI